MFLDCPKAGEWLGPGLVSGHPSVIVYSSTMWVRKQAQGTVTTLDISKLQEDRQELKTGATSRHQSFSCSCQLQFRSCRRACSHPSCSRASNLIPRPGSPVTAQAPMWWSCASTNASPGEGGTSPFHFLILREDISWKNPPLYLDLTARGDWGM